MSLPYLFTSRRSVGILVARLLILEQFGDSPVVVQVDPRHQARASIGGQRQCFGHHSIMLPRRKKSGRADDQAHLLTRDPGQDQRHLR